MNTAIARAITGYVWLIAPLALLVYVLWSDLQRPFVNLSYYVVSWGSLLVLSLCGYWFLAKGPGAKWVLRLAALAVTLYLGLLFLVASSNAPYYGGHEYLAYALYGLIIAFCLFSVFMAGRHAT